MRNTYTFVCCGYNCESWVSASLNSMLSQDYDDFKIICIDAQSTDETHKILKKYEQKYPDKIAVYKNEKRKYQIENTKFGVSVSDPNSIIVTVDLDDWLANNNVLSTLNNYYTSSDVWMTYGTYCHYPYQNVSHLYHDYPEEIKHSGTFKKYSKWLASHLRTFRAKLFLAIPEEALKNKFNEYYDMAGDCAFMYPMLEMSRERTRFVKEILYVYNRVNPMSDDKINVKKQEQCAEEIKQKPINERLISL